MTRSVLRAQTYDVGIMHSRMQIAVDVTASSAIVSCDATVGPAAASAMAVCRGICAYSV